MKDIVMFLFILMKVVLIVIYIIMYVNIFLCKIVFKYLKKKYYYNNKWLKLLDMLILCYVVFIKLVGYRF